MRLVQFQRIAFGDWEQTAIGTIEGKGNYLEVRTANADVMKFLCRCRTSGEVIVNPIAWVGDGCQVYAGDYQVILMDDDGVVLCKTKK